MRDDPRIVEVGPKHAATSKVSTLLGLAGSLANAESRSLEPSDPRPPTHKASESTD
jgi:hypothetical protein